MQMMIYKNDQQLGPYDLDGLREGIARGEFTPDDFACQDASTGWVPLRELVDVGDLAEPTTLNGIFSEQTARVQSEVGRLLTDDQDPAVVCRLYDRVKEMLTAGETIEYIAIQKKPIVTFSPDAIIITDRRFIAMHPKLTGMTFTDLLWIDVADVHLSEQMLGATIACTSTRGGRAFVSHLPKKQARRVYAFAQAREEEMRRARYQLDLERRRASASNVVVQSPSGTPPPLTAAGKEDSMEVLAKLKSLLDSGLIEQSDYDAKKREVLSRM